MATQNYASAHLSAIDERFTIEAKTAPVVNKGGVRLDFNGKNSVTIYTVDVVADCLNITSTSALSSWCSIYLRYWVISCF